jgi:putative transcriptional regulator
MSAAPALIVASHLAMSQEDADRFSTFEQLGGALIDEQPMADVTPDLFETMLARLDEPALDERIAAPIDHSALDMGIDVPAPLAGHRIGKWRTIGAGIRFAKVDVPEDPGFNVVLLRVGPGRALPQHGHAGSELTVILKGSFSDEGGTYGPGDFAEEDGHSSHQPVVSEDGECICLTAIEGRLKPNNWLAKLIMPFYGF